MPATPKKPRISILDAILEVLERPSRLDQLRLANGIYDPETGRSRPATEDDLTAPRRHKAAADLRAGRSVEVSCHQLESALDTIGRDLVDRRHGEEPAAFYTVEPDGSFHPS